jgi:hypothetical protein
LQLRSIVAIAIANDRSLPVTGENIGAILKHFDKKKTLVVLNFEDLEYENDSGARKALLLTQKLTAKLNNMKIVLIYHDHIHLDLSQVAHTTISLELLTPETTIKLFCLWLPRDSFNDDARGLLWNIITIEKQLGEVIMSTDLSVKERVQADLLVCMMGSCRPRLICHKSQNMKPESLRDIHSCILGMMRHEEHSIYLVFSSAILYYEKELLWDDNRHFPSLVSDIREKLRCFSEESLDEALGLETVKALFHPEIKEQLPADMVRYQQLKSRIEGILSEE